jgi:hypothetical protein
MIVVAGVRKPCCAIVWILTKCMVERSTASQIAAASAASFFVALDVGLHVLGRHQPDLMSQLAELARPVMRRGARFHAHRHGGNAVKNFITWLRRSCFLTTTFSLASMPWT